MSGKDFTFCPSFCESRISRSDVRRWSSNRCPFFRLCGAWPAFRPLVKSSRIAADLLPQCFWSARAGGARASARGTRVKIRREMAHAIVMIPSEPVMILRPATKLQSPMPNVRSRRKRTSNTFSRIHACRSTGRNAAPIHATTFIFPVTTAVVIQGIIDQSTWRSDRSGLHENLCSIYHPLRCSNDGLDGTRFPDRK